MVGSSSGSLPRPLKLVATVGRLMPGHPIALNLRDGTTPWIPTCDTMSETKERDLTDKTLRSPQRPGRWHVWCGSTAVRGKGNLRGRLAGRGRGQARLLLVHR